MNFLKMHIRMHFNQIHSLLGSLRCAASGRFNKQFVLTVGMIIYEDGESVNIISAFDSFQN